MLLLSAGLQRCSREVASSLLDGLLRPPSASFLIRTQASEPWVAPHSVPPLELSCALP